MQESEAVFKIYRVYSTTHIIVGTFINIWLIIATFKTLDIINKNVGNVFSNEKGRIKCINLTFATAYCSWIVFDIVIASTGLPNKFIANETNMLVPLFLDLLPISLVFYTHFRNVHSVHRLFKLSWKI